MDRLALAALSFSMDDYESIESVREKLEGFLRESISEENLFAAFCALAVDDLVSAHRIGPNDSGFAQVAISSSDDPHEISFRTTSKGKQVVDREWEKTFGHARAKGSVKGIALRWDQLRRVGETRTAKLTALVPPLAFVLSYVGPLNEFLRAHTSSDFAIHAPLLLVFFIGLLFLSAGQLLYSLFVPYQVAKYIDDVEYYVAERGNWWTSEAPEIIQRIPPNSQFFPKNSSDLCEVTRKYYRFLATEHRPGIRVAITMLYLIGLALTSVPVLFRTAAVILHAICGVQP